MALADTFKILQSIIHIMATSPDGISSGEIARTFGISVRVVSKYIAILEEAGIPIYEERKRYYLDENYFTSFTLTAEESEFLYLLLERTLVLHSDRWRTLQSLLKKLGNKLVAPLADYLMSRLDVEAGEKPSDKIFKLLAQAKRQSRELWVEYLPLHRFEPSIWLIRPFQFTSNYFSDGLYVLCQGSRNNEEFIPLTLKFDRILDAQLTDTHFNIVEMARFASTLGNAWSVWSSDRKPLNVELLFEPRHYDRLLETTWHPSQQIRVDNNDYIHFSVEVSEPEEMVPWIRSWGSGVIVLEPPSLRQRMMYSVQRLALAYGLNTQADKGQANPVNLLWAKYDHTSRNYHLLTYHLLDVAAVAWQMWDMVLSPTQHEWLMSHFGVDESSARSLIALLAGLHDIGKATPAFQCKAKPLYDVILNAGVQVEDVFDVPHGTLSAVILQTFFTNHGIDKYAARSLALVIGGHHGEWISNYAMQKSQGAIGQLQWRDMQSALLNILWDVLHVNTLTLPSEQDALNIFATFLSGFVSVCDWIGSNETYFPYLSLPMEPQQYFEQALEMAHRALVDTGWLGWKPVDNRPNFEQIFPFTPNAMQEAAINACDFATGKPRLILIEYLTGGGKTEIAFYLADLIINLFQQSGIYVAMPTQATSNQLFERMNTYLESRYPGQAINVQLIHAQSEQQPLYRQLQSQPARDGNESGLIAQKWFQNRRRALLSPFAVGTIDQAMLGVLQTRHHFVRQYGLSHKVILFDEIHSYDTYMNQIIKHLLKWLVALDSPIILLSATLSQETRQELLSQVGVTGSLQIDASYPRLTIVDHDCNVHVHSLPAPPTRKLRLRHLPPHDFIQWLLPLYEQGGCIAIVCNTVDTAIEIARLLRSTPDFVSDDIVLFHARTPFAWRSETEASVVSRFGKNGNRPKRMVVIATQIIEQSLDLDFDLIITELAPIDLLIQRAGRLHRHDRPSRPQHLLEPTLVILSPETGDDGIPNFGVNAVIYQNYVLLRTWQLLFDRDEILIPDETDELMNAVYRKITADERQAEDAFSQALQVAYDDMTMGDNGKAFRGAMYCVGAPGDEFLVGGTSYDMPDDEEHNITTRDISPSIDIVCLRGADGPDYLPSHNNRVPTQSEKDHLLQFKISVRKRQFLSELENLPIHPHWKRIPQLHLARPIVFQGEIYNIPGTNFTLRLTPFYGLEFLQEDA